MNRLLTIAVAIAGVGLSGAALAAAEAPVDGTWAKHQDTFTFMGFTSRYSCDGLSSKLTTLLRLVGARPDFKISSTCAAPGGVPDRIATVRMTYHTLLAAGAPPPAPAKGAAGKDKAPEPPEPGVGAWRSIELTARAPRDIDSGDCELVDQFAKEILPSFTTRDLVNRMSCVPHQSNPSGIYLKFSVLGALPAPKLAPVASAK